MVIWSPCPLTSPLAPPQTLTDPPPPPAGTGCGTRPASLSPTSQRSSSSSAASKPQQSWYIYQTHPQYPNDNIQRLLRPGDSLVRRDFGFLLSWDQSLFHPPGCYAKPPCSEHVEHDVRLIICELGGGPVRVCDHQIKGLFEERRLSSGTAFMAGTGGARSSETPPVPHPGRFLAAAAAKEQATLAVTQRRCGAWQTGVEPLARDEGQKVAGVCDANPGASERASLASHRSCFGALARSLTRL